MPGAEPKSTLQIVSPSATTPSASGAIPRRLTRSEVADMLGVSISSVRRLERDRLHPERGPDGTHYFAPTEVTALATALAAERRTKPSVAPPTPKLSAGEIAARAFECFEQRYSLAEVVISLRIEPQVVRELFHEWLVGLTQGELQRKAPALPPEQAAIRITEDELAVLLAALPAGESTRISVARFVSEYQTDGMIHLEVVELGGLVTNGPLRIKDLTNRFGFNAFRVSAYSLHRRSLLWEAHLSEPVSCHTSEASTAT